jgi:predicted O-linked N-acetylglucosamine transferase (SPINDLY family)
MKNIQPQHTAHKIIRAFQEGNYEAACLILDEVLKRDVRSADSIFHIAINFAHNKRIDEALEIFKRLKIYVKNEIQIPYNLGCLHVMQGDYESGCKNFYEALEISPNNIPSLVNYASTLHELKRFDEAISFFDKALNLDPDCIHALCNKGNTLRALKRYSEAVTHYDNALNLNSDHFDSLANKGRALNELKRYDEAITTYEKVLVLNPDIDWVYGELLEVKMKIAYWSGLSDFLDKITKRVKVNEQVSSPFPLLALSDNPTLHKKSSEVYIQSRCLFNPLLGSICKQRSNHKIKVGYFSADFKNHPVAFLIAELFELHDKSRFEIYAFSLVPAVDEMRRRLQNVFDHFIDVEGMSDVMVAKLARDFSIDIAVDLTGHTQDSRTGIFSYRAAPIQVNYLGYPGTIGADYFDYIIADSTLIPAGLQSCYSEKVVYLPNSYQVNDRTRLISDRGFTRPELGLPEKGFIFCCFNNNFKIHPVTFDSWMRILKAVDGSVLWVFQDNAWVVDNLKKEAVKRGIAAHRLVFAERMPQADHLARHCQADLFLDTFPYNAHTTASDALWARLPVLTLMGESFASRVAASLLNAIGLTELITNTQEEYEELAIELALNPKKIADIKLKLASNRLTTPLFDTPLFTKNLEAAYSKMYERYHAGLPPNHLFIA